MSLNSNTQSTAAWNFAQIVVDEAQVWEHPCHSFALDAFECSRIPGIYHLNVLTLFVIGIQ